MNKRVISARILVAEGILLLIVAAIHLLVAPVLRDTFVRQLSVADFQFVWPPFVLAFVVLGILLVALALSTIYCASGVQRGERWAWRVGITNALAVLSLPIVLLVVMDKRYFTALPFLVASILITLVGVSMLWPLVWVRGELRSESASSSQ